MRYYQYIVYTDEMDIYYSVKLYRSIQEASIQADYILPHFVIKGAKFRVRTLEVVD